MNKTRLLIITIILLSLFCVLVVIDFVTIDKTMVVDIIFKILEILFASSAALTLSVSMKIRVSIKENNLIANDNNGQYFPIRADGKNQFNITINQNDPILEKKLIALSDRIDDIEKRNVEDIIKLVISKTKEKPTNVVDADLLMKFISDSKTVSSNEIKEIWASLMASELTTSNKISKRTFELVKNLSPEEAHLFEEMAKLAFDGGIIYKKFTDGMNYLDISILQDIGLVKYSDTLSNKPNLKAGKNLSFYNKMVVGFISNETDKDIVCEYPCYVLTNEGEQIKKSLDINISNQLIKEFLFDMKKRYPNITISMHEIIEISGSLIQYKNEDLLS